MTMATTHFCWPNGCQLTTKIESGHLWLVWAVGICGTTSDRYGYYGLRRQPICYCSYWWNSYYYTVPVITTITNIWEPRLDLGRSVSLDCIRWAILPLLWHCPVGGIFLWINSYLFYVLLLYPIRLLSQLTLSVRWRSFHVIGTIGKSFMRAFIWYQAEVCMSYS